MALSRPALVVAVIVAVIGACGAFTLAGLALLWLTRGLSLPSASSSGYWSQACVTSDESLLVAGGQSFAVLDLSSGAIVGRGDEYVHAAVCEGPRAVVLGYSSTWTWPGGTRGPESQAAGEELGLACGDGTRVWTSRASRSGRISGPLVLSVERGAERRGYDLGPEAFGEVGRAKALPTPDSFRMWPTRQGRGATGPEARLLLAAGWQPGRSFSTIEPLPWGFFAVDPATGGVQALLMPIVSDPALNLVRRPALGASEDGATLALATSEGTDGVLAVFRPPATVPSARVQLAGWDEIMRLAVAPDGTRVAVASAFRGDERPAHLAVFDASDGRRLWSADVGANVYGLALLRDGSLVWASSEREAARVALPQGRELWHARVQSP